MNSKLLRRLPKVDELLMDERVKEASQGLLREQVVDAIRTVIENVRREILTACEPMEETSVSYE